MIDLLCRGDAGRFTLCAREPGGGFKDPAQAQAGARSLLTAQQFKNAVTEVFLPPELLSLGLGFIKPEIMEKTVKVVNEYFDVGRKITAKEVYTNQFLER